MSQRMKYLSIILLFGACSKSASQAAPELAAAAGPYAAEFPGFDMTAVAKKLQGTWVFKGNMDEPTVWSIEGTKVTEIDGDGKTTTGTLEVESPCHVSVKQADGSGHGFGYVFDGNNLHIGLGNAGAVVGKTTYVCDFPTLLRKTGDTCERQEGNKSENGKLSYMWEKTDCALDAKSFSAKDLFGHDVKLEVAGSSLWDDQMKTSTATKVASLDEGKAKQKELAKK